MKIGIVTTWFERGAAYVSKQYEELLQGSHEVFIYARGGEQFAKDSSEWNKDNVTWGKEYSYTTRAVMNIPHFKNWITANNIEAILFNEQHEWLPVLVADKMGVLIGSYIDYYKEETVPLFGVYDFLICNTKRHYSVFKDFNQTAYIPWGTDVSLFSPQPKKKPQTTLTFFHSAGMNPLRKGTDFILKAAHNLQDKNFKLSIHTQVNLKHFFPELASIIDELVASDKLELTAKTVAAPGLYHLGDVYIYPTRLEGIGLTVPEALSCGLPVITTDQAPMNEFVQQGVNGRLIKVAKEEKRSDNYYWKQSIISLDSLILQMAYYIDNDIKIEQFKKQAREYALTHLNWANNQEKLSDFFRNIQKSTRKDKIEVVKTIQKFEKSKPFSYYLNTFKPYVKLKKKVKQILNRN